MPSAEFGFETPPEQKIFRSLRDAIARNQIPSDTRLTVARVAEQKNTELDVVAGAFLLLTLSALAAPAGPGEVIILPISERQLRDTCFLREQAEVEIVRRVTQTADTDFISELREQILRQKIVGLRSPRDLFRLDDRFHRTLTQRAEFDTIWQQLEHWKLCTDRLRFTFSQSLDPQMMIAQHSAIVDRIAMGDAEGAAAAARYHVSGVLRQLPEYRLTHPEMFSD